jgi:hypothetical protein
MNNLIALFLKTPDYVEREDFRIVFCGVYTPDALAQAMDHHEKNMVANLGAADFEFFQKPVTLNQSAETLFNF